MTLRTSDAIKVPFAVIGAEMAEGRRTMALSELIGSSHSFTAVLEHVTTVAPTNCTVLIRGETGTGTRQVLGFHGGSLLTTWSTHICTFHLDLFGG